MLPLRDSQPGITRPLVTWALILANALVWVLWQLPNLDGSVEDGGYFPCAVDGACSEPGFAWPVTVLTSMFMHGSWAHLLGNLLFLWIFGNNVEDAMGKVGYLVFYLLGGTAATATQTFVTLAFQSDAAAEIPNVGASGAIAAVMGAYIVLHPNARITTLFFFRLFDVRAIWYLGLWFLFQLLVGGFSVMQPEQGGGVAFFAHVGGFAFGMLAVWVFAHRRAERAERW
ncbi:MAG: rhomboid family intramembrane serine protease [Gaiella sp.]